METKENKSTFTPGPWLTIVEIGGELSSPKIVEDYETVEQQQKDADEATGGNASIIAIPLSQALAAPDLLAALEGLLDVSLYADGEGLVSFEHPNTEEGEEARDAAKAAIAKAKIG